jgi:hypothetical protein
LFHTSAVVILPLFLIIFLRRNILYTVLVAIGSIPVFIFALREKYEAMVQNYINAQYDSTGTLTRILMNVVPAIIFLLNRKKFHMSDDMKLVWTIISIISCLLIPAFAISPSSTVVDRLGLYLIPIQLMVFGNLPVVLGTKVEDARIITFLVIGYYASVQFIWLNFATNAFAWLPYKSLLWSDAS